MRLIDADALKVDHIVGSTTTNTECYRYVSKKQINEAPTVDAVPIEFIISEIKNSKGFYNSSLRRLLDTWAERKKE